jgi:hypothetical protein
MHCAIALSLFFQKGGDGLLGRGAGYTAELAGVDQDAFVFVRQ